VKKAIIVRVCCGLAILAALLATGRMSSGQPGWAGLEKPTLTVWLMPNEPVDTKEMVGQQAIEEQVKLFNEAQKNVTVLNTSDTHLREQLLAWNAEFAIPNWPIIKGQHRTLEALGRFAHQRGVHVQVLFVNWSRAFQELRQSLERPGGRKHAPDVAQVGSTWVPFFHNAKLLKTPSNAQRRDLRWRTLTNKTEALTVRYLQDIRLLYYWKRLPKESPLAKPFTLDATDWTSIIRSLKEATDENAGATWRPPMAMPMGFEGFGSTNLLWDYIPLVWSGGGSFLAEGSTRVDLSSQAALKIPLLLSREATQKDGKGRSFRILAFPEMGHQEAIGHFVKGDYVAIIEPIAFLPHWRNKLLETLKPSKSGDSFWDYAGVAVPPCTFKGGSDLMITSSTESETAFELARFLASDETYVKLLAELGHLPVHHEGDGIVALLATIAPPGPQRDDVERAIRRALDHGRECPHLPSFATDIESREVLEAMQRLWRRISEGSGDRNEGTHDVKTAAEHAQLIINLRIDGRTRILYFLRQYWPHITAAILVVVIGLLVKHWFNARRRFREEREKNRLLEEIRKVRGFAASALQLVDSTHHNLSRKPDVLASATEKEKIKALMIQAGLRGWRRGSDDLSWKRVELEQVIWRAVILSIDYLYDPRLFVEWDRSGSTSPRTFLKEKRLIRENPPWAEGDAPFYIDVMCSDADPVQMPLMLEHVLICLLTNAFKASRVQDDVGEKPDYFRPVRIEYNRIDDLLALSNELGEGHPGISPVLCDVLNGSRTVDEFESQIHELLRGPVRHWPGIGLVEAYCMAKQCFGGLAVDATSSRVSLRLNGSCKEKR
jgi:ABC-type glycerol-3-phosphate transport system substrate-binding protein